jgi:membrane associated rhomboid family serine protease
MLTETACAFYGGTYKRDALRCADVLCLSELCQLEKVTSMDIVADAATPNVPKSPNQWPRFIVPLFLHSGIIHAVLLLGVQYYFGSKIERQAGFLRVFLIYFISGIGGFAVSGIFSPGNVGMGSDPAVFGLLAVTLVELFQAWQIVPNRHLQLIRLMLIIIVALLVGTLPYVRRKEIWARLRPED